jgi:DNA polymerase-3 subunit delta
MTEEDILKKISNKAYSPIYFLMGEESYYIDLIADHIEANVLTEAEKEFNLTVLYGKDVDEATIISQAKRFPMMANYQVVIVREAQALKKIEELQHYVENPVKSTILVICYKYGKLDKRKTFAKVVEKNGILYESPKIYDSQVSAWITDYCRKRKYRIQPKAVSLLAESLGTQLSTLVNELGKLMINVPEGSEITAELVETNIGINKDYNVFELSAALNFKDRTKANRIVLHFCQNEKEHPAVMVIPMLYTSFLRVLLYHHLPDKSTNNVASALGIKPFFVSEYVKGAANYPRGRIEKVISLLHEYDLKAKGVDNNSAGSGELLKELVYKILN